MAVLGERDRQGITALFADAVAPVEVRLVLPGTPDPASRTGFRAALAELAELIPLITVQELAAADAPGLLERVPGAALFRPDGTDLRIRFAGLPSGYEFLSFVTAAADAAAAASRLQPATLEALGGLKGDVSVLVFSTPSCPHCPRAVRLAAQMALASPSVRSEAVDAAHFAALAGLYHVRGVPRIVFNRRVHVEGAVPEPVFLGNLLAAVPAV